MPANNEGIAGVFLIINITTDRGTINNHRLILNFVSKADNSKLMFCSLEVSIDRPIIKKIINVIIKVGMVVYIIYLIWIKRSVPDIAAARFVVSDRGDILSPKYAPEIIDPATKPWDIPNTSPIPISAIPIVAIVDQELPEAKETMAHIIQEAKRKISGLRICRP